MAASVGEGDGQGFGGCFEIVGSQLPPKLSVYADALTRATDRSVAEMWIVLPIAAGAVQIAAGVP